jgi:LysM repeat protein
MKLRFRLFIFLLLLVIAKVSSQETVHILKKGETIYSIARLYGVDVQTILKINQITDPTKLPAGQKIQIPVENETGSTVAAVKSPNFSDHTVVKGETLYGIARYYEISLDLLRSANNLPNNFLLKEGYVLKIPSDSSVVKTGPTQPELPSALPLAPGSVTDMLEPRPTIAKTIDLSINWPIQVKEIAYMTGKLDGVMLLGEKSEMVKSLTQGIVVSAGPYRGFGKVVIVQRTGGYLYVYGGCESLNVKQGDRVAPGTELGKLGVDPVSIKPQLFLLVRQNNAPLDPVKAPRT